ncbi:hypothetical protein [Marinobacter sp. DY40_1A1]|uniref:hypothetical protein n=1 Tax=Marinobacter sp. DY40_1A1 TaxID=2583229 RepID=UPI001908880A|nr:hypothetical protein [Marinobacter sp. DY40_1A1]MBK1887793.1 hypothetical protein [Marinobacter sp. DY40_1A1]
MPLQNRVTPTGTIEAISARGALMGNRGVLHNASKELKHLYKIKPWITCALEFKGRRRELMTPGAYTELFFLDEVTAFAAGHRPCAECRRARYNEFRDAWTSTNKSEEVPKIRAPEMDEVLHRERIHEGGKVTWSSLLAELPHGTMFQVNGDCFAVCDDSILKWDFEGYTAVGRGPIPDKVDVLTPRSVVKVFANGFRPEFHPTATI